MSMTVAPAQSGTRILGIDPGSRITGFGVIDVLGTQQVYVASGCIRTAGGTLPERIKILLAGIAELVETYRPDIAAVEIVFVNVNPQSTLMLGQARGAVLAALVHAGLPVAEYTALQVKQAVVGHGHASKEQVSHMVQRLLRLTGTPQADAADALGVALTHSQHSSGAARQLARLQPLSVKRGRMA